jgi:two-component system sensor histidine kinase UhpB
VIVSLRRTPKGITLRVSDDGRGIGFRESSADGFGLASMRERAATMGGHLSVKQSGRRGTELEVTIP